MKTQVESFTKDLFDALSKLSQLEQENPRTKNWFGRKQTQEARIKMLEFLIQEELRR